MARDHARIFLSIWDNHDFTALKTADQWTYFALISHRDLSWCGVAPLLPQRLAMLAADGSASRVQKSIATLERARFVVVDRATAEVARIADESQHEDWDNPRVRSIVGRICRALDGTEADR